MTVSFAWISLAGAAPVQIVLALTVFWVGCFVTAQVLATDVVTVVEASSGAKFSGMLRTWTNERLVVEADSVRELPVDDVLSLHFDRQPASLAAGESLVLLANGDRLVARARVISDDVLTGLWKRIPSRHELKLPLESVSAVVFDLPAAQADRQRLFADLQTLPPGNDIALLTNDDRTQGEFERLDGAFVELTGPAGLLKLDRSRVRALRLNPELTSAPRIEGRRYSLSLVDGSHLTATSVELREGEFKLSTPTEQVLFVPLSSVAACHLYGGRVVPLTDREPAEVSFVPYLAAQWPLAKNANVLHGPLSLRGTEFASGLGMHSRMSATYEVKPTDREFRATVGIDDCANGSGSVRFSVELDGRRVWTSDEITGRSPAFSIPPLSVRGAKRLTLLVDFGQKADVADYANWCEAIMIVEPRK